MDLEKQVVNLELSKRLKELSVKQDSLFYWVKIAELGEQWALYPNMGYMSEKWEKVSAFTDAELGEMLPVRFATIKQPNGYLPVEFEPIIGESRYSDFIDKNEANARAKMLIWLIENGKMKL